MTLAAVISLSVALGLYCALLILGTLKATRREVQRLQEQRVDEKYTEWQRRERQIELAGRTRVGGRA